MIKAAEMPIYNEDVTVILTPRILYLCYFGGLLLVVFREHQPRSKETPGRTGIILILIMIIIIIIMT